MSKSATAEQDRGPGDWDHKKVKPDQISGELHMTRVTAWVNVDAVYLLLASISNTS